MNQKKIGEFIANMRKGKGITQRELAEILNVTDRAVSNWENGRRMPDISYFKVLCETLDISINELLSGEKITKNNIKSNTENIIINSLKNKKKSKIITRILLISLFLLTFIILFLIIRFKGEYPKIKIDSLGVALSDNVKSLNKKFTYDYNNKKYSVYYYEIDAAQICDIKQNCYGVQSAFNYNQTNRDKIFDFLENEFSQGNNERFVLYDGGTSIYRNRRYSVILCNKLNGNKDIYFGSYNMVDDLNGYYCGEEDLSLKTFIRTYHINSVKVIDEDLLEVSLLSNNGETTTIKIKNSYQLIVGNDYEFSFYTYKNYEDTLNNIFDYSTILNIKFSDKDKDDQVNEEIIVSKFIPNKGLNEVENVSMSIEKESLTRTGMNIIITDYSGNDNVYGGSFKIEKFEDGKWVEPSYTGENFAFTSLGYTIDINHRIRMTQDWEHMYGTLDNGEYRLVKELNGKYFSVEFKIN